METEQFTERRMGAEEESGEEKTKLHSYKRKWAIWMVIVKMIFENKKNADNVYVRKSRLSHSFSFD